MQMSCESADHLTNACYSYKVGLGPKCDVIWQLKTAGGRPMEHELPKAG